MNNSSQRKAARAVILGLDGTPFSFLKKEIENGTLPNLASLVSGSYFSAMESEIPTISSVAWASFMTGRNPGEHGIYGFTDRKPGTYEMYFPNYAHLKAEPLWDRLSKKGKRCCILNVPSTYPARPLNGVIVSGFVAPNLERATYPTEAFNYLKGMGYRIDVDSAKGRESLDLLLEDLHETMEKRREAMFHFWNLEKWDLFMCVFTGTDRLHHFMWDRYVSGDAVYKPEFMRFYQRLDEIIGEFISEMGNDIPLFMLSDHGFGSIQNEVYLNFFLRESGMLSLKSDSAITINDIDPQKTKAYCLDPGRIYLNLQGREPEGIVPTSAYNETIDEVIDFMMGLREPETGVSLISDVKKREELFTGPQVATAPDLVAIPRDGFDLKGAINKNIGIGKSHLTGMHTFDDAFFLSTVGGKDIIVKSIRDVFDAVLQNTALDDGTVV